MSTDKEIMVDYYSELSRQSKRVSRKAVIDDVLRSGDMSVFGLYDGTSVEDSRYDRQRGGYAGLSYFDGGIINKI